MGVFTEIERDEAIAKIYVLVSEVCSGNDDSLICELLDNLDPVDGGYQFKDEV